ncbi:hypothetical protein [Puerhibacterium puerhi]|uniref:hypothetical protein n=1 Tax=Puerhibacterium puerhi TaxID=2692623 RepID=UPI00135B33D2|nr:hypothetical protein [Puerhibacterium puerhi]
MPADITWLLSGVDANRWFIQKGTLWRPPVSVRAATIDVPGRHGVIAPGLPVFDEPQLNLKLQPVGPQTSLEEAQAELVALLAAPGLTVTRRSAGAAASAPARLVSLSPDDFRPGQTAAFSVALAIPGVFLRGPVASSPATVVASGDTVEIAHLGVSTGPVADAIVRVTGPATTVAVTDVVSGTGLSWAGAALTAGRYLYLDAGTLRAWWSASSSAWTGGTDVTSGLDYPAAGPLQIWPRMQGTDPADRRARLRVSGSGLSTATALMVRGAPAYL